jgi:hypothetical protein
MNADTARSKNDVPIRLPQERWFHVTEEHSEMAGYYFEVIETVQEPQAVYAGKSGECLAVREVGQGKYVVVVYREVGASDGFVITAFLTKRKAQLERRQRLWPP